jgi:threonine/homoserine/homoserine lactone efflux protein
MFGIHDFLAFLPASLLTWLTPGPDTMYKYDRASVAGTRIGVCLYRFGS